MYVFPKHKGLLFGVQEDFSFLFLCGSFLIFISNVKNETNPSEDLLNLQQVTQKMFNEWVILQKDYIYFNMGHSELKDNLSTADTSVSDDKYIRTEFEQLEEQLKKTSEDNLILKPQYIELANLLHKDYRNIEAVLFLRKVIKNNIKKIEL